MAKFPCVTSVSLILRGIQQSAGVGIEVTATDIMQRISNAIADPAMRNADNVNEAVVKQVMDELNQEMKVKRLRHIHNAAAINSSLNFIKTSYADDIIRGVKALLIGDEKSRQGSRASVSNMQAVAKEDFFSQLYSDLEASKLTNYLWSGDHDKDIFLAGRALARQDDEALKALDPSVVKVAEIVQKHEAQRRSLLNRYGAGIKEHLGRIATQMHDTSDIRNAARRIAGKSNSFTGRGGTAEDAKAWVDWTFSRLDKDSTFDAKTRAKGDRGMKNILHGIYQTLSIGDVGPMGLDEAFKTTSPGQNPARSLSADRILQFTDEGAYEYMRMFGAKNLRNTITQEIDATGHAFGLLQSLGPDSNMNMKSILRSLKKDATGSDKQKLAEFIRDIDSKNEYNPGYKPKLSWMFTHVTGHNRRVVNDLPALLGAGVRTFEFVTKLGFSAVSSVTDIGGSASDHYFVRGKGHFFNSIMEGFSSPLKGQSFTGSDKVAWVKAVGVGVDGLKHAMFDRFGGYDSPPGRMTQLMNMYFKWNGLGPWTDAVRRGHFLSNSSYMASLFKGGVVDARQRLLLKQYDLTDVDIDLLSSKPPIYTFNGEDYFDPRLIEGDELRLKMRNFFMDRNNHGVLTPGAETSYLAEAGRGRGDIFRELNSLFWQFKQFPYAMIAMSGRRNIYGLGSNSIKEALSNPRGELPLFAMHIAMLTGMGALSMNIKDILKNREPVVPTTIAESINQLTRAFLHGGSAGLLGDLYAGEAKSVGDFLVRQGGPAVGDFMDFKDFSMEAMRNVMGGDDLLDNKGGTKLWRSIRNDVPFTNVWHTKAIMDILVVYWLAEQLDPGFLEKQNRALENTRGGAGLMYQPDIGGA